MPEFVAEELAQLVGARAKVGDDPPAIAAARAAAEKAAADAKAAAEKKAAAIPPATAASPQLAHHGPAVTGLARIECSTFGISTTWFAPVIDTFGSTHDFSSFIGPAA